VLGDGTGGTIAANRLRRALGDDVVITVVDARIAGIPKPRGCI